MSVSSQADSRTRRRVAVGVGALGVLALAVLVKLHVTDLRETTQASVKRSLTTNAVRAARMVDLWVGERETDAATITEIAGIHGTDSTSMNPAVAGRILLFQMDALERRGYYTAIWLVGESGRIHGAVGGATMSAAEDSASRRAIVTGHMAISRPEQRDSIVTVGIASPVMVTENGVRHPGAVAVFRADMNRALTMGGTVRGSNGITAVLTIPDGHSSVDIRVCGDSTAVLCVTPSDSMSRVAQGNPSWFGEYSPPAGRPMLVATRRTETVPWGLYIGESEDTAFAAMRARLRFEAFALLGFLLIGGLAVYAFDRAANLRRLTERALTEARFSAIVNTAMDAIIIVDPSYQITVQNSAAASMFGYAAEEALGSSVLDLLAEAARAELKGALDQTLHADEQPYRYSPDRYAAGRRRDGSTFPIDLSVSRTQIDGRPHLAIVIRDITNWKRAEESSEWQRRVLESIASGIELRDVLRTIARFHETQCPGVECAIHLIDDDGVTLRSTSAPSMRPEFVESMDEILIGPRAATCGTAVHRREQVIVSDIASDPLWNDYRTIALDQRYLASWAMPIRSPQGRVLGALAMYIQESRRPTAAELRVTATATHLAGIAVDRAHAAESLRQSEASFRSFVENSPIGIYRATGTGRLLAVNESLVQLLGYDSALELLQIEMATQLVVANNDRERLFHQLEAHGELRSADMEWRRKDGTTVLVRISARAYRDERGLVWFSEGFVENVTPLRAAEQALRQSEKLAALGQLVSGVAHELNNPLAAILHFAEDLLDDERTAADLEALSVIRDQARRSRSIVRDLLSFVRFRDAAREHVQLTDALMVSVKALQPTVEEIGARLSVALTTGEIYGNTDRAGLQQIVTNLVVNAAQASGRGGVVRVSARVVGHDLHIVVEDTGPGIPAKFMDRIFEPFFTTKPIGQGTGLGLSVTLGIVQQLGGKISVENCSGAGESTGARFTVALPIEPGSVNSRTAPPPRIAPPQGESIGAQDATKPRVLIIDDEPSIRAALRRFFTRRGWQVNEAEDGSEGLSLMLSGKADFTVVISDLKMPGCSGMELHDHVAAVAPELLERLIFSTGDVASRDAAEFVQRTRCLVMQKPFELRALEEIIVQMRQMATA